MKTTIFILFFLSSVYFFPQPGNFESCFSLKVTSFQSQDTTKIEYWKQEAKKWKAEAEHQRRIAEQLNQAALDNMTFAQRREHEAKLQRNRAEINAQEAIEQRILAGKMAEEARQQKVKAEDWKFLYYNLAEAFVEIDSVFRDFAKQAYENGKYPKTKIAEIEKLFDERKKVIEELK